MRYAIAVALMLAACKPERSEEQSSAGYRTPEQPTAPSRLPAARLSTSVSEGLAAPEAVVHDVESDVYLLSNVNGPALEMDDDGFISRVSPAGKVIELKWIDGTAPDVTLHAPKGMTIHEDTLYVADVGAIRLFDRRTGKPKGSWELPGSSFVNDVAVDAEGRVLVTDTAIRLTPQGAEEKGEDRIHRFDRGRGEVIARGAELHGPNGIVFTKNGPVVAAFTGRELYRLEHGKPKVIAELPGNMLDGLVELPDGSFLVTCWDASGIFHVTPDGQSSLVVGDLTTPASIDYDAERKLILIPLLLANELRLERWEPPAPAAVSMLQK